MSIATYDRAAVAAAAAPAPAREGRGLFVRLFDLMVESRMRHACEEIARYRLRLPADSERAASRPAACCGDPLPAAR